MATDTTAPPAKTGEPTFPTVIGWIVWAICYILMMLVCGLGCPVRVSGRRSFPWRGPVLLLANHQGYLDPPLVGLVCGRPLRYLARHSLFKGRFFHWLIDTLGAIPIDREGSGKAGLQRTMSLLRANQAVLLFPEGTRSETGELGPLQPGVLLLLRRLQVPVVLVGLSGSFDAWSRHRKRPRWTPIWIHMERFHYQPEDLSDTARGLELLSQRLHAVVARANRQKANLLGAAAVSNETS